MSAHLIFIIFSLLGWEFEEGSCGSGGWHAHGNELAGGVPPKLTPLVHDDAMRWRVYRSDRVIFINANLSGGPGVTFAVDDLQKERAH